MPSDPRPSNEFGPRRARIFAMAGAVALPSPRPATAKVWLGSSPAFHSSEITLSVLPQLYLKSVQNVHNAQQVTRIVSLSDLRAVDLTASRDPSGQPATFEFKTVEHPDIADAIKKAKRLLDDARGSQEVFLFDDAVIYVPEIAPVFVRIVYEFGVTAAVAAENIEACLGHIGICC
jgi:hypothetical protein